MTIEVVLGSDIERLQPQHQCKSVIPGERLSLYKLRFMPQDLIGGTPFDLTKDLLEAARCTPASRRRSPLKAFRCPSNSAGDSGISSRRASSNSTPLGSQRPSLN